MIEIDYNFKDMMIQSLRYALYRHSYALYQTCDYIKEHPQFIDERVKNVMLEDIIERLNEKDLSKDEKKEINGLYQFLCDYGVKI